MTIELIIVFRGEAKGRGGGGGEGGVTKRGGQGGGSLGHFIYYIS